jgi:hypothetical protein
MKLRRSITRYIVTNVNIIKNFSTSIVYGVNSTHCPYIMRFCNCTVDAILIFFSNDEKIEDLVSYVSANLWEQKYTGCHFKFLARNHEKVKARITW